jgi:hypothetical protein
MVTEPAQVADFSKDGQRGHGQRQAAEKRRRIGVLGQRRYGLGFDLVALAYQVRPSRGSGGTL